MVAAKITVSEGRKKKRTSSDRMRNKVRGFWEHNGKRVTELNHFQLSLINSALLPVSLTDVTLFSLLSVYSSKGFLAEWLLWPWFLHGNHAALGSECGGRQSQVRPRSGRIRELRRVGGLSVLATVLRVCLPKNTCGGEAELDPTFWKKPPRSPIKRSDWSNHSTVSRKPEAVRLPNLCLAHSLSERQHR